MAEPNTIYKMTILTMLGKVDFPLSNTQITDFFLSQDFTDYFTVQQMINELLDSKLIRSQSTHSSTQYRITPLGRETLQYLEEKMPPSIEEDMLVYFEKNKIRFQNENSILANYYKTTAAGYNVRCQLKEKNIPVVDLTLHVATRPQAEAVCQNWQKKSMDVYAFLMDSLVQ